MKSISKLALHLVTWIICEKYLMARCKVDSSLIDAFCMYTDLMKSGASSYKSEHL